MRKMATWSAPAIDLCSVAPWITLTSSSFTSVNSAPNSGFVMVGSTPKNLEYRQKSLRSYPAPVSAAEMARRIWVFPDSLPPTTVVMPGLSLIRTNG